MAAPLLRRLAVAVGVLACVTGGSHLAWAQPSASSDAATAGAAWLSGELVDGALPGFAGPDWGLTVDGMFALSAAQADRPALEAMATAVAAHVRSFNSYDDFDVLGVRIAGATAKLMVAALAAGKDPTDFGGFDLRQETLDLVAGDADPEAGRVRDSGTTPDSSNTFAQAFAVVGLSRTGGVPQPVVDFLLRQQCAAGGFRLVPDQASSCDEATDPDSTSMAVQALLAADKAGMTGAKAAADEGAAWLVKIQQADGSFGGSGPTEAPNANSTGLAAQALAATGHAAEAGKAAAYLLAHQLTAANAGAAGAELGAVAYDDAALAGAVAGGIDEFARDQWRRATAQAVLGLAMVPLGDLDTTTPPPDTTTVSPSTETTTETTATETTAIETTTTEAPVPQGSSGELAATGGPVTGPLWVGVLLLVAGFTLLLVARRRPA
jgi:hypothetical protein